MGLFEDISSRNEKISVVGLGYVGLPLAIAFAQVADVVAFDISNEKIQNYINGTDVTKEVGDDAVKQSSALFTCDEEMLGSCRFHVVAVPTPVNPDKTPDLRPVIGASRIIGRNLIKGSVIVFESTVYPGVTEDICVPLLEKESGLKYGEDFKVGYSPERINPGDKKHKLESIVKIVSGSDEAALNEIAKVYEMIIETGVYRAESIKVAEAAKAVENAQRDINIAFMNEIAIIFNKMGIDTNNVLEAAGTKWNFLNFRPGLVGGHCIGIDPYYITYKAEEMGYHSQIILSARKINDDMGKYVAENIIKKLIYANKHVKGAKAVIFGVTFKENCPDVRNSKVVDIIRELEEYGLDLKIVDPVADGNDLRKEFGLGTCEIASVKDMDCAVFAVQHEAFKNMKLSDIKKFLCTDMPVLIDVKGIFSRKEAEALNYLYWSL